MDTREKSFICSLTSSRKNSDDAQDKMHADHLCHDDSRDYRDSAERYVF